MKVLIFLAAGLLGPILASPWPRDTCKSEIEKSNECLRKYDHGARLWWWEDKFLEKLFPLQSWKLCVGEARCEKAKQLNELTVIRYNTLVYLYNNFRLCWGNGRIEKFDKICHKLQSKLHCDDRSYYNCITTEMMKNESCSALDVDAYNFLVPLLIRDCQLDPLQGRRTNEVPEDGDKKTETSKNAFIASFLNIFRTIF
ncbi:hypothetical protein CAEBREN_17873 [Caenorhabditis brenneri]|uniref:DUF19 domain-containing protein n=1 Tax=Caenorhabditis brenneri TaxID=135651 RepID=G0NNP0_CAEBE|nr:hypothetical protein CAEBREN_17873 [Caenorhabditis brenneri]